MCSLALLVLLLGLLICPAQVKAAELSEVNAAVAQVTGTTLFKFDGEWYYVNSGMVDESFSGLYKFNGSWYYVRSGKVDFSATTLVRFNRGWYYVRSGKVDFSANTLVPFNGGWYYIKNGKMASGATTLVKHYGKWYYVEKGKVNFNKTTLCKFQNDWYLVKNGTTQPDVTTLFKFNGSWYYLKNGRVSRVTTFFTFNGQRYYIKDGVAQTNYSGQISYYGGTYYLHRGVLTSCHQKGHQFTKATYLYPKTCKRCTITSGEALVPQTREQEDAMAREIAQLLADSIPAGTDLERVNAAAYMVSVFAYYGEYTMDGEDYKRPYGVFVKGVYSCAGCTRALGLILECMGYEWEHINEHQYTHQWCVLEMDGQIGWADGQIGYAGYGGHPYV